MRAGALLGLGRAQEALTTVNSGLGVDPQSGALHQLAAVVLNVQRDIDGAWLAAVEATRWEPTDPAGHRQVAELLARNPHRHDEAVAAARQALELDPNDPSSHLMVAEVVWPLDVPGGTSEQRRAVHRGTPAQRRTARHHVDQALRLGSYDELRDWMRRNR